VEEAVSDLSTDQILTLTELLVILLGIAITWAVFYGSDRAELPGEAAIPDPAVPAESFVDDEGRTLA
jgi:hypothetical protein